MEANHETITPTVSRVVGNMIVELIYDPILRKTALVVCCDGKWRIEQKVKLPSGETLVPYSADNNLIRHECVLLPAKPVQHGDKADLLRDIEDYLRRYVDLSPVFARIAAHYALLTWVYDAFNELPYLRFKGEYGSGKTRALIALGSIVYKGFFASGASTVSPIFHTLDTFGGTLILDEADLRYSDKTADLVKILNNGTVKGLPVLRTMQNRNKEFSPAAFNVYGPKIIAMRGSFRDQALESRFLSEDMGKAPLRADIPIQLPPSLKAEASALRDRLLHFRLTNLHTMKSNPTLLVDGVEPRLNQTALSLLSLVDDAATRSDIGLRLRERHAQFSEQRALSNEGRTVAAVTSALAESNASHVSLQEVTKLANSDSQSLGAISSREVGRILRSASFSLRKSHGTVVVARPAGQMP